MTNISKKPRTILVHGPSGSGKDTQVDLLLEKLSNFEKIVTGDMFRKIAKTDEALSEQLNAGIFPSSKLTYELLSKWMERYGIDNGWIFVSVVRRFDQIALLDELLQKYDRKVDLFIHFSLSAEKAIERMAWRKVCSVCGENYHEKYKPEKAFNVCDKDGGKLVRRDDDRPGSIKKRLSEYEKGIKPILDEYKKRGILVDIDASPSIEEIHAEVLRLF
jgi:adenylate kinase